MFKDISSRSVKAFEKLTKTYSKYEIKDFEEKFTARKGFDKTMGVDVMKLLTGFSSSCPLCIAIEHNCKECMYSLHDEHDKQELQCVESKNRNSVHYNAVARAETAAQLKEALDAKVIFMQKLLKKYNKKVVKEMENNFKYLKMYEERLEMEKKKETPDKDTLDFLKNKIRELNKKIK